MDVLRARAYLDLLLGKDSRPRQDAAGRRHRPEAAGRRASSRAPRRRAGSPGGWTLTVPLTTLQDQADRPGEIPGIGPVKTTPEARDIQV